MSDFDIEYIDHPHLIGFAAVAEEFCDLLENGSKLEAGIFIKTLHCVLPKLYLKALQLPHTNLLFDDSIEDNVSDTVLENTTTQDFDRELDENFRQVISMLSEHTKGFAYYFHMFDAYDPQTNKPVQGWLVDDISDLYLDIRSGLRKWKRGESGEALWEWRFYFEIHWGDHALHALQALHTRAADYDSGWFNIDTDINMPQQ